MEINHATSMIFYKKVILVFNIRKLEKLKGKVNFQKLFYIKNIFKYMLFYIWVIDTIRS
jgi:hypothetical protein